MSNYFTKNWPKTQQCCRKNWNSFNQGNWPRSRKVAMTLSIAVNCSRRSKKALGLPSSSFSRSSFFELRGGRRNSAAILLFFCWDWDSQSKKGWLSFSSPGNFWSISSRRTWNPQNLRHTKYFYFGKIQNWLSATKFCKKKSSKRPPARRWGLRRGIARTPRPRRLWVGWNVNYIFTHA